MKLPRVEVVARSPLLQQAEFELRESRFGAAVVADGDYLYVIGGSNSSGTRLDSIERTSVITGKTESWSRLIVPRRHHRAVVTDGKIFVLGGTSTFATQSKLTEELSEYGDVDLDRLDLDVAPPTRPGTPLSTHATFEQTMEIVDLATAAVTRGPSMPFAKALFGCVALQGKIYVIGGQKRRGDGLFSTNTTEVFDLMQGMWAAGVNMPTPRRCTATVVDGLIMVVGGMRGRVAEKRVEVFNPAEKVWRRLPDLAEPCNPSSAVWLGHQLFLFGDRKQRDRLMAYNLRSKLLESFPLELAQTEYASVLAHRDKIYVVGGGDIRLRATTRAVRVLTLLNSEAESPTRLSR